MTIDATKPTDEALVSELPGYIREARVEINAVSLSGTGAVGAQTLDIAGAVTLTIGAELSEEGLETVIISNTVGAVVLTAFLGAIQGQTKTLIFQDLNIDLADSNTKLNGTFHLNMSPVANWSPDIDDVITLVNIGGDGVGDNGYWREVDRAANV